MPGSNRRGIRRVLFATSNRGKLGEARAILAPFSISVEQYDGKGVEIQADTNAEVASFASRSAASAAERPVLVEDAGLYVDSLKGFPGPYSSFVFKTIGTAGIITLLGSGGSRERAAQFISALAYCEPGGEPVLFEGRVAGTIRRTAKGKGGFGFDPIFVPSGGKKTFAELTLEEKCAVSHRGVAMRKFADWYLPRARSDSKNGFKAG